jgi:hypothetical protein
MRRIAEEGRSAIENIYPQPHGTAASEKANRIPKKLMRNEARAITYDGPSGVLGSRPVQSLAGLATVLAGLAIYFVSRRSERSMPGGSLRRLGGPCWRSMVHPPRLAVGILAQVDQHRAHNIDAVQQEWTRADTSMRVLDLAGVPYNVSPGNHDISTAGATVELK